MKLLNFTIIKLCICFISGILIAHHNPIPLIYSISISVSLLIILFVLFLIAKNKFTQTISFGILSFTTMIFIGILTTNLHNQRNFKNHYTTQFSESKNTSHLITFKIREHLKPNKFYEKYVVNVIKLDNHKVSGRLLLNIEKDSLQKQLPVDETIISKTDITPIHPPLNPNQFNYKAYLARQYIYHQITLNPCELLKTNYHPTTILGHADKIKNSISNKLNNYSFNDDELAVIKALFLGDRDDISDTLYTNYKNAGAVHILAVSGLHVGIILLILNYLFQPLEQLKKGRFLKMVILIICLWLFGILTGLSASVTRAATMFSIITIALHLKRPTNIYNTLAISMFIILLFKPMFLFDVGFQLSYAAVFAIVAIEPHLHKLWSPKYYILKKIWRTFTVTLAAQFGILPLSLFYFHQFPGLFFISNLIIIPFLGIILGLGILIILLSALNVLPPLVGSFYGSLIKLMNQIVTWVSEHEGFIFSDIPFNVFYLYASYVLIFASFRFMVKQNIQRLKTFLITIIICQLALIYTNIHTHKNQLVIFHNNRHSLIGINYRDSLSIASDLDSITNSMQYASKNYQIGNFSNSTNITSLKDLYVFNNKSLLVIDSLGVYNIKSFQPDYVLLRQSPKLNLTRLIDSLKPKYIIADGSNYRSYIKEWQMVCRKRKLPFHATYEQGAFIINY